MDYRTHCQTCGVTIAAFTHGELKRLLYEHQADHLEQLDLFGAGTPDVDP